MLPPSTPLDRARPLVLVRVRLFGEMLQEAHEMIETFTKLGLLLLERLPLTFRLDNALAPLFQVLLVFHLVMAALHWPAHHPTLIFWHHIGEPASLTLNHRNDHIDPLVMLKALTNCEKVTLERTFDAQRGVGKSVDLAAYLHAYPLAEMRVCSTITGESRVGDTKSVRGFG
jgi:hypothetical protein